VHAFTQGSSPQTLTCEREVEGGRRETLAIDLPALLTIQSGSHRPRYPALSKLLRANQYPLEVLSEGALAPAGARQCVVAVRSPVRSREGIMLEGRPKDKAHQLAAAFRSKGLC
jgi:electron transfer flavoprotein beta subunit